MLVADLKELSRVAASIEAERPRLTAAVGEQLAEKQRLGLLLEEKQRLQSERETALAEEQKRSEELAGKATSLKELIACAGKAGGESRRSRSGAPKAEQEQREARTRRRCPFRRPTGWLPRRRFRR